MGRFTIVTAQQARIQQAVKIKDAPRGIFPLWGCLLNLIKDYERGVIMKCIVQLTILLSLIATPFTGFASYLRDVEKTELVQCLCGEVNFQSTMYSECLLIIDLINNTKDSKKSKPLKAVLEVRLRILMDGVLYEIEELKQELAFHIMRRDGATSQEEIERWHGQILRVQQNIEELYWGFGEVEALLEYTR